MVQRGLFFLSQETVNRIQCEPRIGSRLELLEKAQDARSGLTHFPFFCFLPWKEGASENPTGHLLKAALQRCEGR